MVTVLLISLAIVGSVALLCFKGITIRYDKKFTIEDNRNKTSVTLEDLKALESKLNTNGRPAAYIENEDIAPGPMDAVISEIQDLFGPENNNEGDR